MMELKLTGHSLQFSALSATVNALMGVPGGWDVDATQNLFLFFAALQFYDRGPIFYTACFQDCGTLMQVFPVVNVSTCFSTSLINLAICYDSNAIRQ